MSIKVTSAIWERSNRTGTELLTLLALADFANDDGESFPSLNVLAHKVRLSVRQVCHILENLEQAGELRRKRSSGGRNRRTHYVVLTPRNCEAGNTVTGNTVVDNSVIQRQETVLPTSHALNRQRTVNKTGAKAPFPLLDPAVDNAKQKRLTCRAGIPPELQPTVSRVVAKINELAGSQYRDDKPGALRNLIARLDDGQTEAECLAVVEGRHAAWAGNDKMLEYFRPSTLFAAAHFDDYLQAAQRQGHTNGAGNGSAKPEAKDLGNGSAKPEAKDLGNGIVEANGLKMTLKDYERKYGARAN